MLALVGVIVGVLVGLSAAHGAFAAQNVSAPGAATRAVTAAAPNAAASLPNYVEFAYRPFIDGVDLHRIWFLLLIPMAFFVSMTYKAVRLADMDRYWPQVLMMTAQVLLGMIALGAGFYAIFHVYVRLFGAA
jgi:hypothetical protein